jgi:hypothetical protein
MKDLNILFVFALLVIFSSCGKRMEENAIVVKDCTGTYLRISEHDYLVCNPEELEQINSETEITAEYREKDDCNFEGPVCMLYHPYEGAVKVIDFSVE